MTAVGLCQCGCGRPTPLAAKTVTARGLVQGQPVRFLRGHAASAVAAERKRAAARIAVKRMPGAPLPPEPLSPAEVYAEDVAHASALIVGAVHDEGPDEVRIAIRTALTMPAPDGIDPVTALITVLAAQIDPEAPTSARLGWVESFTGPGTSGPPSRQERGAA